MAMHELEILDGVLDIDESAGAVRLKMGGVFRENHLDSAAEAEWQRFVHTAAGKAHLLTITFGLAAF